MRWGLFLSIIITATASASAQRAYWVTEANSNVKGVTIVKVYDFSNQLISETEINRKVDITRKREQRMLDRIVRVSVREQTMLARKAKKNSKGVQVISRGKN